MKSLCVIDIFLTFVPQKRNFCRYEKDSIICNRVINLSVRNGRSR